MVWHHSLKSPNRRTLALPLASLVSGGQSVRLAWEAVPRISELDASPIEITSITKKQASYKKASCRKGCYNASKGSLNSHDIYKTSWRSNFDGDVLNVIAHSIPLLAGLGHWLVRGPKRFPASMIRNSGRQMPPSSVSTVRLTLGVWRGRAKSGNMIQS